MARRYAELLEECKKNGVDIVKFCREVQTKKPTKDQVEVLLRDLYWKRDHAGEKMLAQIEPQMAHNSKDMTEEQLEPILADSGLTKGFCLQKKLDGARFLMHIEEGKNRFTSRRKSDKTYLYSEKTDQLCYHRDFALPGMKGTVLDGEIKSKVAQVWTGKVNTVTELQATIAMTNSGPEVSKKIQDDYNCPLVFHVFDVLIWKGEDVRHQSYTYRLSLVEGFFNLIDGNDTERLFARVETVYQDKLATYEKWVKQGEEGGMFKDLDSYYELGKRTWTWLKKKRFDDVDGIITNSTRGEEGSAWHNLVGDLSVSAYDEKGNLREFARISAFPLVMREAISIYDAEKDEVKVRPDILGRVVVVRCQEWSKNIRVKHAVPLKQDVSDPSDWEKVYFRTDKNPKDCTVEFKKIEEHLRDSRRI